MATLPTPMATKSCCICCGSTEISKLVSWSHYSSGTKLSQSSEREGTKWKLLQRGPMRQLKVSAMARVSVEEIDKIYTLNTGAGKQEKGSSYLFRTEIGGQVKVSVKKTNSKYVVFVEVSSLQLPGDSVGLILAWGVHRSDSTCTQTLDFGSLAPQREPLVFENAINQIVDSVYAIELEFALEHTPFFLSFLLKSSCDLEIRNHNHMKFCVPVGLDRGRPFPLGLSFPTDGTINFAVFSRNAESVILCLYSDASADQPTLELDLDPYVHRTGDIWHVSMEDSRNFVAYGYRFRGTNRDNFDGGRVIVDPYAKMIETRNNPGTACLGMFSRVEPFDWAGDVRPNLSMERLMIYRLNVKGFTQHKSSQLAANVAGTFYGLAEKMDHFKDLGINAVLLEPIFPCDEQEGSYAPFHFFSPMNIYGPSSNQISAINSMKDAVKRLHSSGIEVLLEVVFTHSADSRSLQGIDDPSYYGLNGPVETRRALNCNYPIVQQLILDSIRHWVVDFHIDGFCFMNASSLLRGFHGEPLSRPPLVEAIAFDPILSRTKIIGDCWDPVEAVQKEAEFPHWKRWAEMNSKFCINIRSFLRGDGLLSDLATRLCGSGDLFSDGRGPAFSFNFIARNFGLSLVDLVCFSEGKLAAELSWNCGDEGPTDNTAVLEKRLKQIRNFLFILYISLGVPVLNMGDECGHSTGGSPAYGARKSFDWSTLKTGFGMQSSQFISFLCSFRQRRGDLLQRRNFLIEENIDWHGSNQSPPKWDGPTGRFLAMTLKAEQDAKKSPGGNLFIAFNGADRSESVILPPPPKGTSWRRLVDTALPYPGFFSAEGEPVIEQIPGSISYEMKSYSSVLFEATAPRG